MPRHQMPRSRRGSPFVAPRREPAAPTDAAAALRSLIQDGIVTAAALDARDDLSAAAVSMERLGRLTSGMWRALSRELVTAAARLERQADEHLDNLVRRARALERDPDAVLVAGVAAGHLEEHRETLDALVPALAGDAQRLAAPDVLLGFSIDDDPYMEPSLDDDTSAADDNSSVGAAVEVSDTVPLPIDVWLFVWPAPLDPVRVTIMPESEDAEANADVAQEVSVTGTANANDAAVEALASTCGMPPTAVVSALSTLAVACWSAHASDERADAIDDDDDDDSDDGEGRTD
jgi:hypothetical protein